MKQVYYCISCIEAKSGILIRDLRVDEFNRLREATSFIDADKCPTCGSDNIKKSFGLETTYVSGYGFADKAGVKRDIDMHLMATDRDPYGEHRKMGEAREVVRKLQKSKERDPKPKTIHLTK